MRENEEGIMNVGKERGEEGERKGGVGSVGEKTGRRGGKCGGGKVEDEGE